MLQLVKLLKKRREEIKADEEKIAKVVSTPAIKLTEKLRLEWDKLSKDMKNHILSFVSVFSYSEGNITKEEKFFNVYQNRSTKKVKSRLKEIDKSELYNSIVLASIEATDLDSLCKKLGISI